MNQADAADEAPIPDAAAGAQTPPPGNRHDDTAGMTAAELAEAKRYGRLDLQCMLADRVLDAAYLAAAAFWFAVPLDGWLQQHCAWLAANWSLRLAALLLTLMALQWLISFPLSYYSGYVLEHKLKLSTLSRRGWLWRYAKRNLLAVAFSVVLVLGLYWIIWTVGAAWWVVAAGAFFLVSVVLGQLAPVLILPLFYHIEKLDAPELCQRMARLAEGTGLSIAGVYRLDLSAETVKANAMLVGMGHTRRVLLGDTLLNGFEPDEIEVIFAHEVGHHVHHHIRKLILWGLVSSATGFWVCDWLLGCWLTRHGAALDYAQLPTATLPLLLLMLTLFAFVLEPLQNAVSRHFERQSDRYALLRTGMPAAYRTAFQKLARLNKGDPQPPRLEVLLFHSHPPIAERLAMADEVRPATAL